MFLNYEIWVTLVILIREGFMQVVRSIVIHDVHKLLIFNFVPSLSFLFLKLLGRDGQRVHLARLLEYHIVLIESAYNV